MSSRPQRASAGSTSVGSVSSVAQVARDGERRTRPRRVERRDERFGLGLRLSVVHDDGRACPMQRAGDRRAQPARGSGDECDAAAEPRVMLHDDCPSVRRQRPRSDADDTGRRRGCRAMGDAAMSSAVPLPELTADELAHSQRLTERVRDELAAQRGWIPFSRYMQMALYEPGLGYYSAGARKLGAAGDFITAPEVAPVFGRCLAQQCAEVLRALGGGDLLEFGAGSGALAATLLDELERLDALPGQYFILDVSADLRERQRATLAERVPALASRVVWLDTLPAALRGVMLANEVLDAMPVERFVVRDGDINALGVTWQLGRLDWSETRASERVA